MTALRLWWLPAPRVEIASLPVGAAEEVAGFESGNGAEALAGFGVARDVTGGSATPLAAVARALEGLRAELGVEGAGGSFGAPVLLGAAAFDPLRPAGSEWKGFPAARFVLPRVCFVTRGPVSACAVAGARDRSQALRWRDEVLGRLAPPGPVRAPGPQRVRVEPEEPPASFRARVAEALGAIGRGQLQKVVLARASRLRGERPIDVARLLAVLAAAEPSCARFVLGWEGRWWLGATPESLLRVRGAHVEADALAGSAPRSVPGAADAARARSLRESKKEQEEHAWVRASVREALEPWVDELTAPEAPGVRSTASLHHLHTPFRGRRRPEAGILELAGSVHPTPAVAGVPTPAALAWLRAREPLARGAYAGPVGWVNLDGEGELALALRCALVEGATARCFAGAGIVAGSDPAAELEETRVKLGAVLNALRAVCA